MKKKNKKKTERPFERRFVVDEVMEVRESDDGPKIEGHAAVFNSLSLPMFGFREEIKPGAFKKTIKEADIRALWNHDPNFVLGRNKADTLELREDKKGLFYSATPPDTQWARDLTTSIKRGDVSQSSFGFRVVSDEWSHRDSELIRTITEARLFDVSPVTFPAYEATDSQVRSLASFAGVDGDALHEAVRKAMMQQELADEDTAILRTYINFLQGCVPGPVEADHPETEPTERSHSDNKDPNNVQSLSILQRKLDLLELGVKKIKGD